MHLFIFISGNVGVADVMAVYLRWGKKDMRLPSEISRLKKFKTGEV